MPNPLIKHSKQLFADNKRLENRVSELEAQLPDYQQWQAERERVEQPLAVSREQTRVASTQVENAMWSTAELDKLRDGPQPNYGQLLNERDSLLREVKSLKLEIRSLKPNLHTLVETEFELRQTKLNLRDKEEIYQNL